MSQDSALKTIGVATGICLFCSLFVSVAAVKLKPRQIRNQKLDKIQNILAVAGLDAADTDPMALYRERIQPEMRELATGRIVPEDQFDAVLNIENFDIQTLASSEQYGRALSAAEDIAGIGRCPRDMVLYRLMDGEQLARLILPIYGKGLWSTLYGFLALEADLETVAGITFYEHGETPGLGGEIDNPNWKALWAGKRAFDDGGAVALSVIKGTVTAGAPGAEHQIDGLSGATLTSRGVDNLIQFWLGEHGYGPALKHIREAR